MLHQDLHAPASDAQVPETGPAGPGQERAGLGGPHAGFIDDQLVEALQAQLFGLASVRLRTG
jgi:hypothetical protein